MKMMRVEVVTPATFLAVDLIEAKARLGIETDDRDGDLMGHLATAAEDIGGRLDMTLCRQTLRGWLDGWPKEDRGNSWACLAREVVLPFGPAVTLAGVTTYDDDNAATVMPAADYYFSPSRMGSASKLPSAGRVVLNTGASWPTDLRPVDAIAVEWTAGFATSAEIPERVRAAVLLLTRHLFDDESAETEPPAVNNLIRNLRPWAF
jgi:uncharacterized phiE125 gp8 family phage protein